MKVRALVAVVVLLSGCSSASPTAAAPSPARSTAAPAVSLRGPVFSKPEAQARADAVANLVRVPVRVVVLSAAPLHRLGSPSAGPPAEVAAAVRWWRVPGTLADFGAWEQAHPPPGFRVADPGEFILGRLQDQAITESQATAPDVDFFTIVSLQVGDHVDVRLDVDVIVHPRRTAAEAIPPGVTSAVLTYDRPAWPDGRRALRRTVMLDAAGVAALAAKLNALPTDPYQGGCPPAFPEALRLRLTSAGHSLVFQAGQGWCADVEVEVDGHQQPFLVPGDAGIGALLAPMGLTVADWR